ncbi:MAG: TolC family protein [candidate division Zixibacteria bacterium]|nr:TolC family protein [candidate division Zixibacteria bacterium]
MSTKIKSYVWITSIILLMFSCSVFGQRQVTVSEAIDSVLAINPNILMSKAQVDASRSQVSQATATLLPQLYANAGYTLYEEPNIVTPIHQQGVFPPLDYEIYETNIQLSVPIFDGGRRLTQRRIATANVDENMAFDELTRNELLKQVAEIFILSRQTEDQSRLINKRLASLYKQWEDLQVLNAEGRVSKGDLALVTKLFITLSDGLTERSGRS